MDGGGEIAEEGGGGGVDGVAGGGGEVGGWVGGGGGVGCLDMGLAPGRGGGGEVGVADGEEVGVEGGDVVVLIGSGLVRVRETGGGGCGWGRYYSVSFFKKFVAGVGAFAGGGF